MNTLIHENERYDKVNDNLSLIQKTDGLTFGTDALLLAAYINGKYTQAAELGSGTGIISMLLLTRQKADFITAYEVQEEYADLTRRNAELNSLDSKLTALAIDIRFAQEKEKYDLVFTNPPYMKSTSGVENKVLKKNIARHEICGSIEDFCNSASSMLKFGALFYAVYRPDRLADIIAAMRNSGIEPKRLTFVYADTESESSMVLIEGKKGGKSGVQLTRPLIIYQDGGHKKYSSEMDYIMSHGSFPKGFKR